MEKLSLSAVERERYARHLSIPDVGIEGQQKLKRASVLLIGAGGLGSPAAMYLAAAGVGRIALVDDDVVDLSNLQRQILHGESWLGKPKLESARARLLEINPHVEVELHPTRLTPENAISIARGRDVILDGCDNFATRFLTNDVAAVLGIPLVHGAIHRFEGQLSVFAPHRGGPCYRCLLPTSPAAGSVPNCAEAGVLGVLPGIIGSLQAMEAIKLILGFGEPPMGRMVIYDALSTSFRTIKLARDPGCALCGDQGALRNSKDWPLANPETTSSAACTTDSPGPGEIAASELTEFLAAAPGTRLLDVREAHEFAVASIPGAELLPLSEIAKWLPHLDRNARYVVHCKAGGRSANAIAAMRKAGIADPVNVAGGIDAWLLSRK